RPPPRHPLFPYTTLFRSPTRLTAFRYDWRNRLEWEQQALYAPAGTHAPLVRYVYNDLDLVTEVLTYDGEGLDLRSNDFSGVSNPSRLRARTATTYDGMGRVNLAKIFAVDPVSGNTSDTVFLETDHDYDGRGNLEKITAPGGLVTQRKYDGAGRLEWESVGSASTYAEKTEY